MNETQRHTADTCSYETVQWCPHHTHTSKDGLVFLKYLTTYLVTTMISTQQPCRHMLWPTRINPPPETLCTYTRQSRSMKAPDYLTANLLSAGASLQMPVCNSWPCCCHISLLIPYTEYITRTTAGNRPKLYQIYRRQHRETNERSRDNLSSQRKNTISTLVSTGENPQQNPTPLLSTLHQLSFVRASQQAHHRNWASISLENYLCCAVILSCLRSSLATG